MKEKPVIGILGCGWLGLPLAKELLRLGYRVKGTTTRKSKINKLRDIGISAHVVKLTENSIIGEVDEFLQDINCLIIDVPPGLRKNPKENFVKKMNHLFTEVEKSEVKHVIYVSSTSIFEEEENFPTYKENDIPNATSSTAQQLIEVENLWQSSENFITAVVRFGGLVGEDRHPVKYLAGRENMKNPDAPVNLIEQNDAIRLLIRLVEKSTSGIFHGVYPIHPSRDKYYSAAAKKRSLEVPLFDYSSISKGKKISSKKTSETLSFELKFKP